MSGSGTVDTNQVQAEIEIEAENWRRQNPEIPQIEHEIAQAWAEVTPAAAAIDNESLLEQTVYLSEIDPNVPAESRLGIRRFKQLIRKSIFWYIRYVTDQFNIFTGTLIRWLRKHEERLTAVEGAVTPSSINRNHLSPNLYGTLPQPSPKIATQIARLAGQGRSLVLSGGTGIIVNAINESGGNAYGVEPDVGKLLTSLQRRIDVRHGDIDKHLASISDIKFDTVIFAEIVEVLPSNKLHTLIDQAIRVLGFAGRIIVAVADPANRNRAQSELYMGLGLSPHTWQYLLEHAGLKTHLEPSKDTRITDIVVAESPHHISGFEANQSTVSTNSRNRSETSSIKNVDLLIPHLSTGDATSNHTRLLKNTIESKGINVRIISETVQNNGSETTSIDDWTYEGNPTILQHSIGSRLAELIIQNQIPIILNYHNITPSHFFDTWHLGLKDGVDLGRQQLQALAPLTRRAIADSEFNALELRHVGFEDVVVSPVLWELSSLKVQGDRETSSIPKDRGTILFVGRIAPNKCHHDLISALALLSQKRANTRLLLIGDASPVEYLASLKSLARRLGVSDQITFAGKVPYDVLRQSYGVSDVFASASEHEGFGVPLVEAMANGLPVVAYDAAAVTETIQGAGLLLADKRPATLATALDRVLGDQQLRDSLRACGIESAKRFDISVTREKMWAALKDLLAE